MAARRERELEQSDTQVDIALEDEAEGRTQPFSEVARAEAALERSRERVEHSVSALRDAIARRTDWRGWVAHRPAAFLGAAVFVGFVLGFRWRGGRSYWR
jgi:ElaB/YqjD/DUF883 family membrane-anchored ribosome-binding protein